MSRNIRPARTWRRPLGALAGLTSALAGLAVAELASVPGERLQSPVLDVGDRVVDGVPVAVKTLAIEWFGTKDKLALLIGIGSLLTVYAVLVGVLSVSRRWRLAIAGVGLFGLVGAYASQTTRRAAPWYAVTPSLLGGIVAALVLTWLRRQLIKPTAMTESSRTDDEPLVESCLAELDRRRFMLAAGATAAGALVIGGAGRVLGTRSGVGNQRDTLGLPIPSQRLTAVPASVSAPAFGVSPFFTPNDDFYRIDTALTVPQVSVDGWKLKVKGLVDRELTLSYEELIARPVVESDITLTCVSNEVGGKLMGTARWLGVRLDDLLAEAGIDPNADQIVGRSVDGYTCGFPVSALDGRDALIAIGMNGEPLPLEHGYPARLIVPGLYGYVSATKWLTELELTRFDQFDQYWVDRGWVQEAPIKVQSRIDTPKGLCRRSPPETWRSPAWRGHRPAASTASRCRSTTDRGPKHASPTSSTTSRGASGHTPGRRRRAPHRDAFVRPNEQKMAKEQSRPPTAPNHSRAAQPANTRSW